MVQILGGQGRRVSPEIFLPSRQNAKFGDGGGLSLITKCWLSVSVYLGLHCIRYHRPIFYPLTPDSGLFLLDPANYRFSRNPQDIHELHVEFEVEIHAEYRNPPQKYGIQVQIKAA